jgi:hypothetical protein
LRSTFVSTGSERFETARLTTDRPRARFSCMTESFTSGFTPNDGRRRQRLRGRAPCGSRSIVVGIFSLSSHSVIIVIMVWTPWTGARHRAYDPGGRAVWVGGCRGPERRCVGGRPGGQSWAHVSRGLEQHRSVHDSLPRPALEAGKCPHPAVLVHRIGPVVHMDRRQNRFSRSPLSAAALRDMSR